MVDITVPYCIPLYLLSFTHPSPTHDLSFFLYIVSSFFVLSSFSQSFLSRYFIVPQFLSPPSSLSYPVSLQRSLSICM